MGKRPHTIPYKGPQLGVDTAPALADFWLTEDENVGFSEEHIARVLELEQSATESPTPQ